MRSSLRVVPKGLDGGVFCLLGLSRTESLETERTVGRQRESVTRAAGKEDIVAGEGQRKRNPGGGIQGREFFGQTSAPAGLCILVGDRRLPTVLLIVMREEVHRPSGAIGPVLRSRDRPDQRPDIERNPHLSRVPDRLQRSEVRMQAEPHHTGLVERSETPLRDCEARAWLRVLRILGRLRRNDRVIAVVAPIQEDADERLVIGGGCGGGFAHRSKVQGPGSRNAGQRQQGSALQESAA